ncbi:MAG: SH3 domain-containing protein [Lawsonibacter sp.]|nr:SH3 domain-containing protein [Lawsonibacter sp.]
MHLNRAAVRMTAVMLLVSTMLTPASALTGTVTTKNSQLRMRAEASNEGKLVTKLNNGVQVEVLDILEGWYQVSYEGLTGYVASEYMKLETESEQEETPVPLAAESEPVYVRVVKGPLNVRSGPGTDYEKVDQLYTGKTIETQGLQNDWYKIASGYISAEYVVQADPAEATKGQEIADYALQFLGCRYVYGGSSPKGFDCSGFTSYVYKQFGYSLNRTASAQLDNGTPVAKEDLQPGDLVMFKEGGSKRASHVGMYIGNGQIIHASTASVGVIISDLYSSYYVRTYVGARRIV